MLLWMWTVIWMTLGAVALGLIVLLVALAAGRRGGADR